MAAVADFHDHDFEAEVLEASVPVVVDFWAEWCGPCRRLAPVLEEVARDFAGKVKVGRLDVDQDVETTRRFRVLNIPTLLIFNKGQVVERLVGYRPKEEVEEVLGQVL